MSGTSVEVSERIEGRQGNEWGFLSTRMRVSRGFGIRVESGVDRIHFVRVEL